MPDSVTPSRIVVTKSNGDQNGSQVLAGSQGIQQSESNGTVTVSFRFENLSADPGSPETGRAWLRTDL